VNRLLNVFVTLGTAAGAVGLCLLLADLEPTGLADQVAAKMSVSGAEHPVTSVLLNFRGYDTFLEMVVLMLAVMGVRIAAPLPMPAPQRQPGPVLGEMLRLLVPLLILVAAYLLWLGAFAPGGAFQAGAVLGAAGVLLLLVERQPKADLPPPLVRFLLAVGVAIFAVVALWLALLGDGMLTLPVDYAGLLILVIETLATIAIAVTLIALFAGLAATED